MVEVRKSLTDFSTYRHSTSWVVFLAFALGLIIFINPVGYLGGGLDDWRYLNAARCWAEQGPCLPTNHWEGRWPLVGALGAVIAVLGESRMTVGIPTLLYSCGCLILLTMIGNRLFFAPVGYLASLLLLCMPTFAVEILDPSVGSVELFFLLASGLALTVFAVERRCWQAIVAGLAWGLACQVRETALIGAIPLIMVIWRYSQGNRIALIASGAAAAVPFIVEALIFWSQTGQPLFRRLLSIGHTQIASSELLGPVDDRHPPFFNAAYIANWRRDPGIYLHWTIDGFVNLMLNVKTALLLLLALIAGSAAFPRLLSAERRDLGFMIVLGMLWSSALIYGLAIDPKPRMMFVLLSIAALSLSLSVCRLAISGSRLIAIVLAAVPILIGISVIATHPRTYASEAKIGVWASRYPNQIMVNATARTHLALLPAVNNFASLQSERPFYLVRKDDVCTPERPTLSRVIYRPFDHSSLDPFGRAGFGQFCLLRRDVHLTSGRR